MARLLDLVGNDVTNEQIVIDEKNFVTWPIVRHKQFSNGLCAEGARRITPAQILGSHRRDRDVLLLYRRSEGTGGGPPVSRSQAERFTGSNSSILSGFIPRIAKGDPWFLSRIFAFSKGERKFESGTTGHSL